MTITYVEFDTVQSDLLVELRTRITSSPHWTRPNAGGKPDLYKCVNTEGVQMVVDFADSAPALHNLNMAVWRESDGTVFTDKMTRWLYWRVNTTGATSSMPLHCVLSLSQDHIYLSVEGPRANESGASSTSYGSVKNYFFMDRVVRYHTEDVLPAVFVGGGTNASASSSTAVNSHQGNFTLGVTGSIWAVAKLFTLDFPSLRGSETIQVARQSVSDGKFYLSPYVTYGDEGGIRGRLANFFHAGYTHSDTPEVPPPPTNSLVDYEGVNYKLLAVNKSDGTNVSNWNQFGGAANNSSGTFYFSPVVAIPHSEVAPTP